LRNKDVSAFSGTSDYAGSYSGKNGFVALGEQASVGCAKVEGEEIEFARDASVVVTAAVLEVIS
jgi:hypothetical protein